jgi:diamine N-acetyltransferase
MSTPRLEPITRDNVYAACGVTVRPDQQHLVAPVVMSLAEAYAYGETAWPRLVLDDGAAVAFVMGGFDPDAPVDAFRCGIWRLNVAAEHQGRGYGRFAVDAVLAEARRRGSNRATVLWKPGPDGPERFYLRLGFRPTGEILQEEVVGEISLV